MSTVEGRGAWVLQTCKVTDLFCISSLPRQARDKLFHLRTFSLPSPSHLRTFSLPCPWRLSRQKSHNGIVGLGVLRLLLDGEAVAVFVKLTSSSSFAPRQYSSAGLILLSVWRRFGNAITLGVGYPIAEDCGFLVLLGCTYRLLEH